MIALIGSTCSGKDTIKKELLKLGYENVVTTTTRPMRDGEIQDISYHFIDDDTFLEMEVTGQLAESTYYETVYGRWYYGSQLKDLENHENKVIILNPDGVLNLMKKIDMKDWVIFYINCPEDVVRERLKLRGDNLEEAERRIAADKKDFMNIERVCDFKINNDGKEDIHHIAQKINYLYGRNSK